MPVSAVLLSVVVKDLRLEDEDKDKDLKIGSRRSSRTRTFLEDNNTAYKCLHLLFGEMKNTVRPFLHLPDFRLPNCFSFSRLSHLATPVNV